MCDQEWQLSKIYSFDRIFEAPLRSVWQYPEIVTQSVQKLEAMKKALT